MYVSIQHPGYFSSESETNVRDRTSSPTQSNSCNRSALRRHVWDLVSLKCVLTCTWNLNYELIPLSSLQGAKCGSSTIDRHFQKLMEERFGEAYTSKPSKLIGPKSIFMNEFESLKRRLDMDTNTDVLPLVMDLESSEYYDAEDAEIILKRYFHLKDEDIVY